MCRLLLIMGAILWLPTTTHAFQHHHHHDHHHHGNGSYPQVYGPTGHLYGPTQAHYQYQRQYGRPWHGYGGIPYTGSSLSFGPRSSGVYGFATLGWPFGFGYSSYGYSSFGGLNFGTLTFGGPMYYPAYGNPYLGPNYSWYPLAPQPQWNGVDPFNNGVLQGQQAVGVAPQNVAPNPQPVQPKQPQIINPVARPANPEAKARSLRLVAQGDEWFVKQNYLQAYARYKQAATEAADFGTPRFRMGISLAAMGNFDLAVTEIKRGLNVDANWPATGELLEQIYGPQNVIAKDALLHKAADWVRQDIRDPNRVFLMGVLLHFNEEQDKARTFFETADQLASSPAHVRAFLRPVLAGPVQQAGHAEPAKPPELDAKLPAADTKRQAAGSVPEKPSVLPINPPSSSGPKLIVPDTGNSAPSRPRVVDFPPADAGP